MEGKADGRRAGAAGTVGGEQGAEEEQLFRILRSLSDLVCVRPKMVNESLSVLELQLYILD